MASKKTILIITCILAASGALYLNRAYAHIYQTIDAAALWYPNFDSPQTVVAPQATSTPLVYVALGDSLTAGVGVATTTETYAYQFAQHLANNGQSIELHNFGAPGARVADVLNVQTSLATALQPDIITILIGTNDMHGGIRVGTMEATFTEIITSLHQKTTAKIYVLSVPYLGDSFLLYPPYKTYFDWQVARLNQHIQNVCSGSRCSVIDIATPTKAALQSNAGMYSADHFHPNALMHAQWAQLLYAATHR